jgi:hypothetical protein
MLKNTSKQKEILHKANFSILLPVSPALVLVDSAGWIARELWWTNKEYSLIDIIPPWYPSSYITRGMNNTLLGGYSSET